MPRTEQCHRCGRVVDLASADYVEWQVYGDGTTVCPRCLTPSDRQDGGSQLLTEGENDAVLRDLDPDNEAG
ncbi:hypothetical protein GCM10023403_50500 [Pseudonocardia benzenivorans]